MKSTYLKHLLYLVLYLFTQASFAQYPISEKNLNCYEQVFSHSGISQFFDPVLVDIACNLKNIVENDTGSETIKVFGYDLYPVMAYIDDYDGFASSLDRIKNDLNSSGENYLAFIKKIYSDGNTEIEVYLKLPEYYSTSFNALELEAIKGTLWQTAKEGSDSGTTVNGEYLAIQSLIDILNGTENVEDPFDVLGFKPINFEDQLVSFESDGNFSESAGDRIYDLAGVMSSGLYLRDAAKLGISNIIQNPALIFTSDINHENANGYTSFEQLNKANDYFNGSLSNLYIVWLHFKSSGEVLYKTKLNISESDATSLIDLWYENSIDINNGGDTALRDEDKIDTSKSLSEDCNEISCTILSFTGKCCIMPNLGYYDFSLAVATGVLDGLIQTGIFFYDLAKGLSEALEHTPFTVSWFRDLAESCFKERSLIKGFKNKINSDIDFYNGIKASVVFLTDNWSSILNSMQTALKEFFDDLNPLTGQLKDSGYALGLIVFEVVLTFITGGSYAGGNLAKVASKITKNGLSQLKSLKDIGSISNLLSSSKATMSQAKRSICKILWGGCFVKDTPVLVANKNYNNPYKVNFGNTAKAVAVAASMPIVAVPIQDVQLLDYAVAHETVNEQNNLIASTDEDLYMGLLDGDPYTSPQQKQRDKYELNDVDWYSVSFEQVDGTSKGYFALTDDWIKRQGYETEKVVSLHLPEQGINGPFRVTSIKHIIPQKKPSEDAGDGYDWKPVTGLFEHQSNQVYEISFDNGEELGVTYQHPIYSKTEGDWKLAGELEIGEEVLTKSGNTKVVSSTKKEGSETVYNLEVKDLHNFLVGESGVVVHNNYYQIVRDFLTKMSKADKQGIIDDAWGAGFPEWFKRGRFIEELLGQTRFKDWLWTGSISSNFPAVDYARQVAGKYVAASVKSTKTTDVGSWISSNTSHLNKLRDGKLAGEFVQGANRVPADLVELHIYVPQANFSQAMESTWTNAIKAAYPDIKVVMSTVEKQVGL